MTCLVSGWLHLYLIQPLPLGTGRFDHLLIKGVVVLVFHVIEIFAHQGGIGPGRRLEPARMPTIEMFREAPWLYPSHSFLFSISVVAVRKFHPSAGLDKGPVEFRNFESCLPGFPGGLKDNQ